MRPATLSDAPQLMALIRSAHSRSKYADGRCNISDVWLQQVVCGMIASQGQKGPQATCVFVVEREGKIVAFMAGIVDRVYHFLTKLKAQDLFLINEGGKTGDTLKLVDAYIAWARAVPAVLEICLSWTDTMPGSDRLPALCKRKGFEKSGEIWEIYTDAESAREAA